MENETKEVQATERKVGRPPVRKEIGSNRVNYKDKKKLSVTGRDPNFIYRTANNDDAKWAGRVENLLARGYQVCDNGEQLGEGGLTTGSIGSVVGKPVGNGVRGVLMRIPKEFYEEDQRQKREEVDNTEKGLVDESLLKSENTYGEGLKVSRKKPSVQVQQN